MAKVAVWTDADLDGAGSYIVLRWLLDAAKYDIDVHVCTTARLREDFIRWLTVKKLTDYETIYFLDLDTSTIHDLVDEDNVIIFDHHVSHIEQKHIYKSAKCHIQNCKSTAQLIYLTYMQAYEKVSNAARLRFIMHVSDYDSYTLAYPESKQLNYLYWTYTGKRHESLMRDFYHGFRGFNDVQKQAIAQTIKKVEETVSKLESFCGELNGRKVISAFCRSSHNDIAEFLISKYDTDIVILVNTSTETVSFRKNPKCDANLAQIAETLCNGGGHAAAAGGKITEDFLNFTKTLTPCHR